MSYCRGCLHEHTCKHRKGGRGWWWGGGGGAGDIKNKIKNVGNLENIQAMSTAMCPAVFAFEIINKASNCGPSVCYVTSK